MFSWLIRQVRDASPWTWITIAGCATLTLVDFWRDAGSTGWPILRGSLPNFVAVPTLTFAVLAARFRDEHWRDAGRTLMNRLFTVALATVTLVVVAWEFLQLSGNLVFDPLDLAATGLGAVASIALFLRCRP